MSLISDVKTVQNTYATEAVAGTSQAASSNSIYTDKRVENTQVEDTQKTSKIDELLEKLVAEFKELGLNVAELKNSGILFRITGLNQQQIENASEEEFKEIYNSLKAALEDFSGSENIDLDKLGKRGNEYYLAQKTGWSINGFRKWNAGKKQEQNLFTRLKELTKSCPKIKQLLDGYDKVEDVPEEKLKEAVDIFLNEVIIGGNKSPENVKKQLQTFGRLLINTPDSEKKYFKNILSSLVAENKAPGLDAVLASFDTPENRSEWASSWTVEEMKSFNKDVPVETATLNIAKIVQYQKEEAIRKNQGILQEETKDFFEKNKEILEAIAQKEDNEEELTNEEKIIKAERDNLLSIKAGEIAGTTINEIINKEIKAEILDKMNRDAYELPIYKEVIEAVKKFARKNEKTLVISEEEFTKILDEATNGNYSKVVNGNTENLNAPYTEKTAGANNENGQFKVSDNIDLTRPQVYKEELYKANAQEEEKIQVVKLDSREENVATEDTTNNNFRKLNLKLNAFKSYTAVNTYLKETGDSAFEFATEVFRNFSDASNTTQKWAVDFLTNSSFAVQELFLNRVTNSLTAMTEAAKKIDLEKFNLIGMTTTTRKQVEKIQEQKLN